MIQIIWTTTQNGAAIFFNSKWVEYTGISVEDSYGFGWYHAVHPDDLDAVRRAWAGIGTDRLELEFRFKKWDGEYRWHLVWFLPLPVFLVSLFMLSLMVVDS